MSSIQITDLYPAGSELFQDSESFLQELTDNDTTLVGAGRLASLVQINIGFITFYNNTLFSVNTNTINGNTIGNGVSVIGRR